MINVAHLFSPRHAARAVQTLKTHKWTQLEYAGFLERVATYRPDDRAMRAAIAGDTLKALANNLPKVSNPILRRACLDHLRDLGPADLRNLCCASFLSTQCYEEACDFVDPESDTCTELIAFGGAEQVYAAARSARLHTTLWSRLFEAFVTTDNYEAAREIWLRPDRPVFKAAGEEIVLRFVELIGRYKDKTMLKQFLRASGENGELVLKSSTVAACLNCFADDQALWWTVWQNEHMLKTTLVLQDGRFVSDALASRTLQLLTQFQTDSMRVPTLVGNLLLQGIYRQNTSRSVLHAYRLMLDRMSFEPDEDTARILANAAYRLGNSKLLGYEIWKEFTARGSALDRRFYETILMCQLVGPTHRSALFFVSEMFRRQVPLRGHIQRILFNNFERVGDSARLLDVFQHRRAGNMHREFDIEQAAAESAPGQQALANASVFVHGQNPHVDALEELENMLAFDARKDEQKNARSQPLATTR